MDIVIFHERCHCKEWKVDDCKKACDNDANCKGFVQQLAQDENWDWYSYACEYATVNGASTCESSGCSYVRDGEEGVGVEVMTGVGDLDDGHREDYVYCGCWRKVIFIIYK